MSAHKDSIIEQQRRDIKRYEKTLAEYRNNSVTIEEFNALRLENERLAGLLAQVEAVYNELKDAGY